MINLPQAALPAERILLGQGGGSFDLETLRRKINSEEYIYEAVQRIAQVLSNELLKTSREGIYHARQRKRRK